MRSVCGMVLVVLLSMATAFAVGNETVIVPVPDSNSSQFRSNLTNFLSNETPSVLGRYFPSDWVFSGGLHTSAASCVSPAFATEAFTSPTAPGGRSDRVEAKSDGSGGTAAINYAAVGANCSNPGSDQVRVAVCSVTGNATGNWQRASGSNYFVNAVDATPAIPAGCAGLMDVVITNGAITSVANIAKHSPVPNPPDVVAGPAKNVRECGALVDGVTDDTVALNTCLATYSHVFVPAGILKHSGDVALNVDNRLSGVCPGTQDPTGVASNGMTVLPCTTLRYTGAGNGLSFVNTALTPISGNIIIENLMLRSTTAARAIYVKNVIGVWIDRVFIDGRAASGIAATGYTVAGIDIDMTINGTDATFDVRVTNSQIYYIVGKGIRTGGNNVNIVSLLNNGIQGASGGCISVEGHGLGVVIQGNEMEGCGVHQLFIDYGAAVHVVGNYSELSVGATTIPWMIQRCTGCTFENNVVFGSGVGVTPELISIGKTAGGFNTQGVTFRANYFAKAACVFGLHGAQGLTIEQNVLFFDVTNELCGDANWIESFNYKRATCDPTGSGTTCTRDEAYPVTFGQTANTTAVVNSAAKTLMYEYLIKGHTVKNVFYRGGFEIVLQGILTNITAAPFDFTVTTELGATELSVLRWEAVAVSGGSYAFLLRGHVLPSPAFPGNQDCYFYGLLGAEDTVKNTVTDTGATDRFHVCYGGVAGVNLALDQLFKISVTLSIADPNASFTKSNVFLRRIGY